MLSSDKVSKLNITVSNMNHICDLTYILLQLDIESAASVNTDCWHKMMDALSHLSVGG